MKNAEQPINPLTPDLDSSKHECIGLTKREYFAGIALQGLLAGNYTALYGNVELPVTSYTTKLAVEISDAILTQLETK